MTEPGVSHETFTIERRYPNARSNVWSAWSIREKKAAWLGDPSLQMDFRVGGSDRAAFRDAMGEHVNDARYFAIQDGERIVLAYSMALNGRVHTVSLTTVTFADDKGGTRLTYVEQMCVLPPSDGVEGRRHGWAVLLDQLGAALSAT